MTAASISDRCDGGDSDPSPVGRWLRQAAAGFAFWLIFVIVLEPGNLARAAHAGVATNFVSEALRMVCAGLLGASICPPTLWLGGRFPLRGPEALLNGAVLLVAIAVLALAMLLVAGLAKPWLPPSSIRDGLGEQIAGNFLLLMAALAVLVGWSQLTRPAALLGASGARAAFPDRIAAKIRGRTVLLEVTDIEWVEAQGNYVALHVGDAVHLVRETMAGIQTRLDPGRFARVHRGCIVNVERVRDIRPLDGGDASLTLASGSTVRLSRNYRSSLRRRLPA